MKMAASKKDFSKNEVSNKKKKAREAAEIKIIQDKINKFDENKKKFIKEEKRRRTMKRASDGKIGGEKSE
jgi:hypothetical protein